MVIGSYGIGGICAPLIATAMVTHGIPWSRFFWLLFSLSIFNSFSSPYVFWNTEKEAHIPAPAAAAAPLSKKEVLKKSLMDATTMAAAIFIFAYQGTEVANSGWTVSFLITVRNGDATQAGLIASGFWIGKDLFGHILDFELTIKAKPWEDSC
jgi:fucose permease